MQFHYSTSTDGKPDVDYVHIPGGATVVLEDSVFTKLLQAKTKVQEMVLVESPFEGDVPIKMGREDAIIKDYYPTGNIREVNLLEERIKRGDFTIVEPVKVVETPAKQVSETPTEQVVETPVTSVKPAVQTSK